MTYEIALVLSLLVGAIFLFVLERPRADVVAILLLTALAITGLLTPEEALRGFSSPAVVTVWAVFILSGGLSRTGVAHLVGRQILKVSGSGEIRLMVLIMLVSGVLSAFMNNVGATALLLPVVMDLARRTSIAPSKLLIPLSFSSLLGGMQTLIGTPPNILVSQVVQERGLADLGLFAFTPVGASVLVAGIVFMVLIGRHLLPSTDLSRDADGQGDMRVVFGLHKRLLILKLPDDSSLAGKTLAQCRIQPALGLAVLGISRDAKTRLAPSPQDVIRGGDRLMVEGRPQRVEELSGSPTLTLGESELALERVAVGPTGVTALRLAAGSKLRGKTLIDVDFRNRYGPVVIALRRSGDLVHTGYDTMPLEHGDILLLQARPEQAARLTESGDFEPCADDAAAASELDDRLMRLRLPEGSALVGKTLADSGLSAFGLLLLVLERGEESIGIPGPEEVLREGDALLVKGDPEDLEVVRGLQTLEVERYGEKSVDSVESLESTRIGLAVAAISPNSQIARKTLRGLHFREKYGLSVLAIWRQGRVLRQGIGDERLAFGDALLLHGSRDRLRLLASEPDFLILSDEIRESPRFDKAPVALALMAGVLAATISGWLPIYISAVLGAALMIVTGCLRVEDAYREIEWRAVFLIAGMLPMGMAMEKSGAARYIADLVVSGVGDVGPRAILAGIFLLAMVGAQVMPTSAVALLLAPIAIDTATQVDVSPLALVMAVAVGSSTAFISPVTHPANVLVMGPGGYRFSDYVKVGLPLAGVTFLVVMLVLPLVFPL